MKTPGAAVNDQKTPDDAVPRVAPDAITAPVGFETKASLPFFVVGIGASAGGSPGAGGILRKRSPSTAAWRTSSCSTCRPITPACSAKSSGAAQRIPVSRDSRRHGGGAQQGLRHRAGAHAHDRAREAEAGRSGGKARASSPGRRFFPFTRRRAERESRLRSFFRGRARTEPRARRPSRPRAASASRSIPSPHHSRACRAASSTPGMQTRCWRHATFPPC